MTSTSPPLSPPAPAARAGQGDGIASRIAEWIFRRGALRGARAAVAKPSEAHERIVQQAQLLVEVARRVAEPVEALPKGSRSAVIVSLYREAIFEALTAEELARGGQAPGASLPEVWAAAPPERLLKAAGDERSLEFVRVALLERSPAQFIEVTPDDAARVRAFAEALLWDLDAPTRAVEQVQVQRWTRVTLLLVLLVLAALGVRTLLRGPNLANPKVFKTSSTYPECTPPNRCGDLFFHTQNQESPWIDFDLGAVKPVHQVEVTNRSECCAERAIPLIVEVSVDDKQWVQVARRDTDFTVWKASFPSQKARHVRFRVPRNTTLHFDEVAIR